MRHPQFPTLVPARCSFINPRCRSNPTTYAYLRIPAITCWQKLPSVFIFSAPTDKKFDATIRPSTFDYVDSTSLSPEASLWLVSRASLARRCSRVSIAHRTRKSEIPEITPWAPRVFRLSFTLFPLERKERVYSTCRPLVTTTTSSPVRSPDRTAEWPDCWR